MSALQMQPLVKVLIFLEAALFCLLYLKPKNIDH